MRVFSSWRRLATSSSVSAVSSRPNSRISARSLARDTFMRSGLALAVVSSLGDDDGFAFQVGFDLRQVEVGRVGLGLPRRPCPLPATGLPLATGALALLTVSPTFVDVFATFFLSSSAAVLAGLFAGVAALVGATGFLAVMQFLDGERPTSFDSPTSELRAFARNSRSGSSVARATTGSDNARARKLERSPDRGGVTGGGASRFAVLAGGVGLGFDPRSEGGPEPGGAARHVAAIGV